MNYHYKKVAWTNDGFNGWKDDGHKQNEDAAFQLFIVFLLPAMWVLEGIIQPVFVFLIFLLLSRLLVSILDINLDRKLENAKNI